MVGVPSLCSFVDAQAYASACSGSYSTTSSSMWVSPSSIHERRSSPETAPTPALRMVLLLKSMNVGMLVMRRAEETSGFWSTSIFTNLTRPAYSGATSAKMGLMYLQGPHQVAQKSTSTGVSASSTSAMKFSSETGVTWL